MSRQLAWRGTVQAALDAWCEALPERVAEVSTYSGGASVTLQDGRVLAVDVVYSEERGQYLVIRA